MSVLHDLPDTWGVRELAMSSDPIQGFIPFSWSDKDIDMELPGLAGDCRALFAIMEPWLVRHTLISCLYRVFDIFPGFSQKQTSTYLLINAL